MKLNEKLLNTQYGALQSVYWMLSGIIFGFTTVFLQAKDYTNYEIGIVFALGNIAGFIAQPLTANLVDKSCRRALLSCIKATAILSLLLMLLVLIMPSSGFVLSAAFIILIAGNILLQPLCISLSFYIDSWGYSINFSSARAIGSFSYALSTALLGILVERVSSDAVPVSYIIIMAVLGVIAFLFSTQEKQYAKAVCEVGDEIQEKASGLFAFIAENKRFTLFMLGTSLLFFTHSLQGNFMIEFVRNVGGNSADLGNVLAFMTLAEVPVMLLFARLTRRFSCSSLLKLSVIMFTVKIFALYLAPSLPAFYAAEALQAFSFAIFVPASVRYVDEVIVKRNAVKGQSYITAMISLGSIFASYIGGMLLDKVGASQTLLSGVLVSAAGTLVMLFAIQKTK